MTCHLPHAVNGQPPSEFDLHFLLSLLVDLTWLYFILDWWKADHLASRILFNWLLGSGYDDVSINVYSTNTSYLIFPKITQLTLNIQVLQSTEEEP